MVKIEILTKHTIIDSSGNEYVIAVVRQQFIRGINCSIFLYRNSFGANQHLSLTQGSILEFRSFHVVQFRGSSRLFDTMHVVCTDLQCVVSIGLLSAEFSTVNTGVGGPMLWKPLCLLSTPEVLATTNYQLTDVT